jgi:hypothetical protein
MSIQIGSYNFEGPFTKEAQLRAVSGVYAILGRTTGSQWRVVDIGEAGDVYQRVSTHDRAPCWRARGYGELAAAALYVSEVQRMLIERQLRGQFNPPCGER